MIQFTRPAYDLAADLDRDDDSRRALAGRLVGIVREHVRAARRRGEDDRSIRLSLMRALDLATDPTGSPDRGTARAIRRSMELAGRDPSDRFAAETVRAISARALARALGDPGGGGPAVWDVESL